MFQLKDIPPRAGEEMGIDVSEYQGAIDWSALPGNVRFAFIRASDGSHPDKRFDYNAGNCRIPWGAYHAVESGTVESARANAEAFVEMVGQRGCLPPMLDFERAAPGDKASLVVARAMAALDVIERAWGRQAIVYSYTDFIDGLVHWGQEAAPLGDRLLFLARYTQDHAKPPPRTPSPWSAWTIWQASGGRKVSRNFAVLPNGAEVDVDWTRMPVSDLEMAGF